MLAHQTTAGQRTTCGSRVRSQNIGWSSGHSCPALTAAYHLLMRHPRLATAREAFNDSAAGSWWILDWYHPQQQPGCRVRHELLQQHQHAALNGSNSKHQLQGGCQQRARWRSSHNWHVLCLSAKMIGSTAADGQDSSAVEIEAEGSIDAEAEASIGAVAAAAAATAKSTAPGQDGHAAVAAAAAALSRLQQVLQRSPAAQQSAPLNSGPSNGSSMHQQLLKPVRPRYGHAEVQPAQQQRQLARQDNLLSWRSKQPLAGTTAAAAREQDSLQQQQHPKAITGQQQQPGQQQAEQQQLPLSHCAEQVQPLCPLPVASLEPSFVDGRAYVTSPVSIVASTTVTRRLAGSISAAFLIHSHQLMFAVGPQALGIAVKALATARRMLADQDGALPVNILMQPTLRGGRTQRQQSFALDIMRVGDLPMQPGVTGRQQLEGQTVGADARLVHITSTSNETAAARSLVENMPARGQTIMRVMGPYATETAVLAVALARPLMQARWGQDLAVLVMWNEYKAHRSKQTGLLLSVFRCELGSFPPKVLLQPPSSRIAKRIRHRQQSGQQQGQKREIRHSSE